MSRPSPTGIEHFYYHADGNGNVTALVASNQLVVARYLYDPFGNTLSASGPIAEANLYRFSSKEFHAASGLVYYMYRFYDPNLQRWPNRDPIEENGGINLYGFTRNNPIVLYDTDGRGILVIGGVIGGVVVAIGDAVVVISIVCLLTPTCRDALGNLLREAGKELCKPRPRPQQPPETCPKTGELDAPGWDTGDTFLGGGSFPPMKICIYTCPKKGVVRRYFPEGTTCEGSIDQP
jgi:RHS repeat-associated protein